MPEEHPMATRLWWMLRAIGFDGAAVLVGGFDNWQAEGGPVRRRAALPARSPFPLRPRPGLFVGRRR